jgi:hypothetical protein
MNQTEYTVTWTINVTADTPAEAAMLAYRMATDLDTTATFYEVHEDGEPEEAAEMFEITGTRRGDTPAAVSA